MYVLLYDYGTKILVQTNLDFLSKADIKYRGRDNIIKGVALLICTIISHSVFGRSSISYVESGALAEFQMRSHRTWCGISSKALS